MSGGSTSAAAYDRAAWAADARRLHAELSALETATSRRWSPTVRRPDGVLTNAGPIYPPALLALWPLLERAGVAVTPADWMAWSQARLGFAKDRAALEQAPLEDVAMWFLALLRSERFGDGNWGAALDGGGLLDVLDRLIALSPELPYDGARSPWASVRKATA